MSNLQKLIADRQALDEQIRELQSSQKADAIAKIRALMTATNLTIADIHGKERTSKATGGSVSKVAAKYRDEKGNSWSGRGLKPKWLSSAIAAGAKQEDFVI